MKFTPQQYAQSFWQVIESTNQNRHNIIIANFIRIINKYGDISNANKILKAIEHVFTNNNGGHIVQLEFARQQNQQAIEKLRDKFNKKDLIQTTINPTLIAGIRITIDENKELDLTMQRKLNRLFINSFARTNIHLDG